MDQPDLSDYPFEYDIDEGISLFCQLYPNGANASTPGANQVAPDDRGKYYDNALGFGETNHNTLDINTPIDAGPAFPLSLNSSVGTVDSYNLDDCTVGPDATAASFQEPGPDVHSNLDGSTKFRFRSGAVVLQDRPGGPKKASAIWPNTETLRKNDAPSNSATGTSTDTISFDIISE
ncbi:hypothetical protein N0V90_010519 [Kalmusia sp. IMI 367209]|nr:hypothetical protein N0V90_010519 [Kalmusia sp. IMI 367209]